ncbi:flagellar hook-length control protein FliK [Caproicibacter sp.]|uniref:flagellar hook-length control protein FliK n=1 Tax=Caproicibacter sp. TaxID=2814884 RepID=UPI00398A29C6
MIQQISAQSMNVPQTKPAGESQPRETDEFRSMLKSAVQKSDSKASKKAEDGKTKKQAQKTDESDRGQSKQGVTAASPSPQESALFIAPGKIQTVDSPADGKDGGTQKGQIAGIQAAAQEASKTAGAALVSGAEQPAETAAQGNLPSVPDGKQPPAKSVRTSGTQAAVPVNGKAASQQGTKPNGTADARAKTSAESGQSGGVPTKASSSGQPPKTESKGISAGTVPDGAAQAANTADSADQSSAVLNPVATADPTIQDVKTQVRGAGLGQSGGDGKTGRSGEDGKGNATAATDSLSNLYGTGNIVIKVSGEAAQAPSPVHQVANTAAYQLQNGKNEFQMDLYPQSLGKVSLKMTSQNGLLTVEILAADPKTQSLLLSGSAEIRTILQASTGQNVQTVIPNQQAAQWYGQPQDGGGGNSGNQGREREKPRKGRPEGIGSVSSELSTGDFLTMIQQIGAFAR